MKSLVVAASMFLCVALSAIAAPAAVSLSLSPQNAQVAVGGQLQFVVTVSGTSDSVVIWSVSGAGCSGHHVWDDQRRGSLYRTRNRSFSIHRDGNGNVAGRCHGQREFHSHDWLAFNGLRYGIPEPGCARDQRTAAVFCQRYWYFEHVSDVECQRYWLCGRFLRFDQPSRALHCSEQRSLIFSNHCHCGIGGQSRQIGFGLISRAIRVIGFRFGNAEERPSGFWRTIAVLCIGLWKHKSCRGVECLRTRVQRDRLRHDHSRRALHRACKPTHSAKRDDKGDSDC